MRKMQVRMMLASRPFSAGFTLVEMAVVLVVIGLIISAVTLGRGVVRNADYEHIASHFVQGWSMVYNNYYVATGDVPGDSSTSPTGRINGNNKPLCGTGLRDAFLGAGVAMPEGRAHGKPDHYGYQDDHGIPHDLQVCMLNADWSDPGASVGQYVSHQHNVLKITGLTPSLAEYLDKFFDGKADARFGNFRLAAYADSQKDKSEKWPLNETARLGATNGSGSDITQSAEVTAYLRLNQ